GGIAKQRVLLGVARIDETEQQVARRESRGRPRRGPLVVARPRAVRVEATDQQLHRPLEGGGKADFLREATQVLFARDRARYRRRRGGRRAEEELCHVGIILELQGLAIEVAGRGHEAPERCGVVEGEARQVPLLRAPWAEIE